MGTNVVSMYTPITPFAPAAATHSIAVNQHRQQTASQLASATTESMGRDTVRVGPRGCRLPLHPNAVACSSPCGMTLCPNAVPGTSGRETCLPRRCPTMPHAKQQCSQHIRGPRGASLTHVLLSTPSVRPKQPGSGQMVQRAA